MSFELKLLEMYGTNEKRLGIAIARLSGFPEGLGGIHWGIYPNRFYKGMNKNCYLFFHPESLEKAKGGSALIYPGPDLIVLHKGTSNINNVKGIAQYLVDFNKERINPELFDDPEKMGVLREWARNSNIKNRVHPNKK